MKKNILGVFGMRSTPEASQVKELVQHCNKVIVSVEQAISEGTFLITDLSSIKKQFSDFIERELKWANDTLNEAEWKSKKDEDKKMIYDKLNDFFRILRALNKNDLRYGVAVSIGITVLLVVTSSVYLYLHVRPLGYKRTGIQASAATNPQENSKRESRAADKAATIYKVQEQLELMETGITSFNGISKDDVQKRKKAASNIMDNYKKFEELIFQDAFEAQLSYELIAALAKQKVDIQEGQVTPEAFNKSKKSIAAALESINSKFFWINDPRKWVEIMFWSCLGTMVGVLFYVAKQLDAGIFHANEISMILTEIVITPYTVITIFFLFSFAGITSFVPTESSIYQTLGIAFILGFAIRRTAGLLDTIKKRILPDPTPEDKST